MSSSTIKRRYVPVLIIAALLAGFGLLADEVNEGATLAFDKSVLLLLRTPGNQADPIGPAWLEEAARDITALGSFSVLTLIVIAAAIALLLLRRQQTAAFVVGAAIGGSVLSTVLKSIFNRPRPELTGVARVFTPSFPSGHATISTVVYLTLAVCLAEMTGDRRLKIFYLTYAGFLSVIVGLSRLYLGVHYPTDVAAGWAIGTAWALLCWVVASWLRLRAEAAGKAS